MGSGGQGQKQARAGGNDLKTVALVKQPRTSIEYIFEILKRYDVLIGQANAKASFLISISGVLVGTLIMFAQKCSDFKILLISSGILLLAGLVIALFVVFPLTNSGDVRGEYTSFIAYSSVAEMKFETYQSHHMSEAYDFWTDLIRQAHLVAKIAHTKYILVRYASIAVVVALIPVTILFLI